MFMVALLSFSAGYFLNEEKSLARLCRNLGYAHAGWFVLAEQRGFFIFGFLVLLSFVKSWLWSILLLNSIDLWYIPVSMYILGNLASLEYLSSFHFTYGSMPGGILLAINKPLFQALLTVLIVSYLLHTIFLIKK